MCACVCVLVFSGPQRADPFLEKPSQTTSAPIHPSLWQQQQQLQLDALRLQQLHDQLNQRVGSGAPRTSGVMPVDGPVAGLGAPIGRGGVVPNAWAAHGPSPTFPAGASELTYDVAPGYSARQSGAGVGLGAPRGLAYQPLVTGPYRVPVQHQQQQQMLQPAFAPQSTVASPPKWQLSPRSVSFSTMPPQGSGGYPSGALPPNMMRVPTPSSTVDGSLRYDDDDEDDGVERTVMPPRGAAGNAGGSGRPAGGHFGDDADFPLPFADLAMGGGGGGDDGALTEAMRRRVRIVPRHGAGVVVPPGGAKPMTVAPRGVYVAEQAYQPAAASGFQSGDWQ